MPNQEEKHARAARSRVSAARPGFVAGFTLLRTSQKIFRNVRPGALPRPRLRPLIVQEPSRNQRPPRTVDGAFRIPRLPDPTRVGRNDCGPARLTVRSCQMGARSLGDPLGGTTEIYVVFIGELAETEGFEPSMRLNTPYSLSRGAPSATRSRFLTQINYLTTTGRCQPASGPDRRLCAGRAQRAPCISRRSPPRS